jgi:hypothetical protein
MQGCTLNERSSTREGTDVADLNDPTDEEVLGHQGEEEDPAELYAVPEEEREEHDPDPELDPEGFAAHVAEVDQELGEVPEGSDDELVVYSDEEEGA